MTQAASTRRAGDAGVTLIEMLVVLVLFGVLAGAVVLALPGDRPSARAEVAAASWTAALDRAVDTALATGEGFGLRFQDGALTLVTRDAGGQWAPHSDAELAVVKLFPDLVRSSGQADPDHATSAEVYAVSAALVPAVGVVHLVRFGSERQGVVVRFDGATVRMEGREDKSDETAW